MHKKLQRDADHQRETYFASDAGEMQGEISTGAIVAIVLFLKASYFAISLPLIAASFFFRQSSFKRFLGLTLGFCIVLFAILAHLRVDIRTVVEALWMAASARSKALYLPILTRQLISQVPSLLTAIAIPLFGTRYGKPAGSWLIWTVLVCASDSLLMLFSMQSNAMPHRGVFDILISSRVTVERLRLPVAAVRTELPHHSLVLLLCTLLVVPRLALDLVGLVNGVFQKIHPAATAVLVRFTDPHLA